MQAWTRFQNIQHVKVPKLLNINNNDNLVTGEKMVNGILRTILLLEWTYSISVYLVALMRVIPSDFVQKDLNTRMRKVLDKSKKQNMLKREIKRVKMMKM